MEKSEIILKAPEGEIFQIGSIFPAIAGSSICLNGKEELKRIKINVLKSKVINYLTTHNKVRISDLAELFDVPPRLIGEVLYELEKEGVIREAD